MKSSNLFLLILLYFTISCSNGVGFGPLGNNLNKVSSSGYEPPNYGSEESSGYEPPNYGSEQQDDNEPINDNVQDTVQDTTPDTVQDTTPDTVQDTTPDTVQDTTPDTVQDTTPDTVQDTTPDTVQDTTPSIPSLRKVDILFVEDTSISMREDRFTLYRKFKNLFQNISHLDWQIAITATEQSRYGLNGDFIKLNYSGQTILKKSSSNYAKKFQDGISFDQCNDVDTDGWLDSPCTLGNEHNLEVSIQSINSSSNAKFFRSDAELIIVYISDEDETVLKGEYKHTPENVINAVKSRFGDNKKFKALGIIIQPGDTNCLAKQTLPFNDPGAQFGDSISELTKLTAGNTTSICKDDYSSLFKGL